MQTVASMIVQHKRPMMALSARLANNATDADDVFQGACEYALRSKTPASEIEKPKSWLYQCVANSAKSHRRNGMRLVPDGGESAVTLATGPSQEHTVRLGEILRQVSGMSERRRDIFERVAILGYGQKETAKELGTWPRSVQLHYEAALEDIEAGRNRPQKKDRSLKLAA